LPNSHSTAWDEKEAERMLALIKDAEGELSSKESGTLPEIPMPWIKGNAPPGGDTDGYGRNDRLFLHHLAIKTFLQAPAKPILDNT
jgi:hypothetical protein